jgi:O-succinylbenzoate synthase
MTCTAIPDSALRLQPDWRRRSLEAEREVRRLTAENRLLRKLLTEPCKPANVEVIG